MQRSFPSIRFGIIVGIGGGVLESSVERGIRERLACVGNACCSSLLQEERCNRKAIYGTVLVPGSHDLEAVF